MLAVLSCSTLKLTCKLGTEEADRWNMEGLDLTISLSLCIKIQILLQIMVNTADCSIPRCENEPSIAVRRCGDVF